MAGNAGKKTEYSEDFRKKMEMFDSTKKQTVEMLESVKRYLSSLTSPELKDKIPLGILGETCKELGQRLEPNSPYAWTLNSLGWAELKIAEAQEEFRKETTFQFIKPLENWIATDCHNLRRHRQILKKRRSDMDSARNKNSNTTGHLAHLTLMTALHDQEKETVEKELDKLPEVHNHHRLCFKAFLEAKAKYHKKSTEFLRIVLSKYKPESRRNTGSK